MYVWNLSLCLVFLFFYITLVLLNSNVAEYLHHAYLGGGQTNQNIYIYIYVYINNNVYLKVVSWDFFSFNLILLYFCVFHISFQRLYAPKRKMDT